jgi:NAD(P)-dependent dehydrogenase (short-subunit alcohol dehydrogenase family)
MDNLREGTPLPGPDLFRLDGRVALVTGAGGAFGRAIALGLARAGAAILATDLDAATGEETASLVRDMNGRAVGMPCDIRRPQDIDAVFDRLDAEFGRIDVLVNNAGFNPGGDRPEDLSLSTWEETLRTNLTGYMLCAQAAGRRMIAGGRGGCIINISSTAGSSSLGRGVAFGVSKAGDIQLTRELAIAWAHHGIRVNAIQPCQFINAGWRAWLDDPTRAALNRRVLDGIPIGRMGQPDEMVGPVLFLASPASSMVTGISLAVDGGNLALNAGGSLPGHPG